LEQRRFFPDGTRPVTLAARLSAALKDGHAHDIDLIPHDGLPRDWSDAVTPAAVLIPVTNRADPGVILTQRPDTMRKHAGQVAFPGGRVDAGDRDAVAAALREADEEIALPPDAVTIVGTTDLYRTITGFHITPVIGVIPPDLIFTPNSGEVEAVFEVPLAFLMDPANHQTRDIDWNGQPRSYYEMHWDGRRIWGATAAMIVNLSRRLRW
jgi:8-oxo-dGTP pyrophosphatase MutT (NUDIX family)